MIRRGEAFLGSRRRLAHRKIQAGALAALLTMGGGIGFAMAASDPTSTVMSSLVRINAGGEKITDRQGMEWEADTGVGGEETKTDKEINGAWDQALFQTQRTGAMTYSIPVEKGKHTLRLYFAALDKTSQSFNIMVENKTLVSDYNPASVAGPLTADVVQLGIDNDDSVDITLTQGASLAGIEILEEVPRTEANEPAATPVSTSGPSTTAERPGSDWTTDEELLGMETGTANHDGEDHSGGSTATSGQTPTAAAASPTPLAAPGGSTTGSTTGAATTASTPATAAPTTSVTPTAAAPATKTTTAPAPAGTTGDIMGSDQVTETELGGQQPSPTATSETPTGKDPLGMPVVVSDPISPISPQDPGEIKEPTKTKPSTTAKKSAYRMNVGGKSFTEAGLFWRTDTGSGGTTSEIPLPKGANKALGSVRHGSQKFVLPMLNGSYQLEMKFLASESFNVKVEGVEVVSAKTVEAGDVATMSVPVTVSDGVLNIDITSKTTQSPALASIELFMSDDSAGSTPGGDAKACTMEMLVIDGVPVSEHPGIAQPAHKDDNCQWVDGNGQPIDASKAPNKTPAATPASTTSAEAPSTATPDPVFGTDRAADWVTEAELLGQTAGTSTTSTAPAQTGAAAQAPATTNTASTDTGVTATR